MVSNDIMKYCKSHRNGFYNTNNIKPTTLSLKGIEIMYYGAKYESPWPYSSLEKYSLQRNTKLLIEADNTENLGSRIVALDLQHYHYRSSGLPTSAMESLV